MKLAKVLKKVISTIKHPSLDGLRLYLVQPIFPDGTNTGETFITIDSVNSSIGSTVIIDQEGGGSQEVLNLKGSPIQSVIVAIVDKITKT
ncbi:EutN/CcmL family microcompartment protein [bacterium]|nr:EutN/CcmL family microcompartment protein [bacterium]